MALGSRAKGYLFFCDPLMKCQLLSNGSFSKNEKSEMLLALIIQVKFEII